MKLEFRAPSGVIKLSDEVLDPYRKKLAEGAAVAPVRLVFAAAHLVFHGEYSSVEHSLEAPGSGAELAPYIDWDATMALRVRLDSLGFGIAEAMDTAQRFAIGWENASQLIERCGALGLENGFVAGAGVDHLEEVSDEATLIEGVVHQARFIQEAGGIPILLPMLALPAWNADEETYVRVYSAIIEQLEGPLFVHWLGEMFLPALAGYFPGRSFERVMELDASKVRGAKLSMLDTALEKRLRADMLSREQIMLTGDDFHFGRLIEGPAPGGSTRVGEREVALGEFSHGLLGIFDAIAEPAALALQFLARGEGADYRRLMKPCETLSRHLFQAPTRHYKAGLAFLSWLNGAQQNPMLAQHEQRARDVEHYLEAARLASAAGVIVDPEGAAARLAGILG